MIRHYGNNDLAEPGSRQIHERVFYQGIAMIPKIQGAGIRATSSLPIICFKTFFVHLTWKKENFSATE